MKTIRTMVKRPEKSMDSDIVEWRADLSELTIEEVKNIDIKKPLLYTNRGGSYTHAINSGVFEYVDFDLSSKDLSLVGHAKNKGLKVIISYHNYHSTPTALGGILDELKNKDADIVKLVVTPKSEEDIKRLKKESLTWKKDNPDIKMIIIALGKRGLITRSNPEEFGSDLIFDQEPTLVCAQH